MFERFSIPARAVIDLAQTEARIRNHAAVTTAHILLALLYQRDSVAVVALRQLGLDLEAIRVATENLIPVEVKAPARQIVLSPRTQRVFELALREMFELVGHQQVEVEHLLLGLIREEQGTAAKVLLQMGADLVLTRQQILSLWQSRGSTGD